MESNEQTELTSKTETDSEGEQMTVMGTVRGGGIEEKGLLDMHNSVVIAGGKVV